MRGFLLTFWRRAESGRVAEWLMAPVLKTGVPERVSGVRIPPLPPISPRLLLRLLKHRPHLPGLRRLRDPHAASLQLPNRCCQNQTYSLLRFALLRRPRRHPAPAQPKPAQASSDLRLRLHPARLARRLHRHPRHRRPYGLERRNRPCSGRYLYSATSPHPTAPGKAAPLVRMEMGKTSPTTTVSLSSSCRVVTLFSGI